MSNKYSIKARKLSEKYDVENELLIKRWFAELQNARNGDGSTEGKMPAGWRTGWKKYLRDVEAISLEKRKKLVKIADAKTDAAADILVKKLNDDYIAEVDHYDLLVVSSKPSGPPGTPGELARKRLSNLLELEAADRREYFKELNGFPMP